MFSPKFNTPPQKEKINEEKLIYNKEDIFQLKKDINIIIDNIKSILYKNIDDNILIIIDNYFCQINKIIEILMNSLNFSIISKNQIENTQRRDEQNIRILYGKFFHEKLMSEILENKLYYSKQKEKEYELLKQKTGAIICNGKVICNERKDNEIIILRTENSLLKSAIKNNEDLIQEKNDIINTLNNDILLYKTQLEEILQMKSGEFSSFSNINININESKNNYSKKKIYPKKNGCINTKKIPSSSKNNKKLNTINVNYHNNIYSSYQINSHLMNKSNNSNSSKKSKRDKLLYNNINSSKNNTIEQNNTNGQSYKYISVNKSLFSPKNDTNDKNNNKKSRKSNNKLINTDAFPGEYNTISNDIPRKKDSKHKKNIVNKKIYINHRKANSIQLLENSLKKMSLESHGKIEKSSSKENKKNINNKSYNLFSVLRKISEIKNKSLQKNSQPSSMTVDNLNSNKQKEEYFNLTMFPYSFKKNVNKGRNEKNNNNSKISGDNSFSYMNKFINKTFINKISNDSYL